MNQTLSRVLLGATVLVALTLLGVNLYVYSTREVPVLKAGIEANTLIREDLVEMVPVPDAQILLTKGSDGSSVPFTVLDPAEVANHVALVAIPAGVPITSNMLGPDGVIDPRFPYAIEQDTRRIKYYVPTDLRRSSGGLIRPGDLVNVLVSAERSGQSQWVIQRVRVIGALTEAGTPVAFTTDSATNGGNRFAVAGYLLSLLPEQIPLIAQWPSESVSLLLVTKETEMLVNVPCGIDSCVMVTTPSLPTPTPTPGESPVVVPIP
jgi:hypothetical protein